MTTVKKIIDQKASTIFSVRTTDPVENVLKIMDGAAKIDAGVGRSSIVPRLIRKHAEWRYAGV